MKFRVTTNGVRFRPERLIEYRFLFARWQQWRPLYRMAGPYGDYIEAEYDSADDAQSAIEDYKKHTASVRQGWVPVSANVTAHLRAAKENA